MYLIELNEMEERRLEKDISRDTSIKKFLDDLKSGMTSNQIQENWEPKIVIYLTPAFKQFLNSICYFS